VSEFPKNLCKITGEATRDPRIHQYGEGRQVVNINTKVTNDRNRTVYVGVVGFDDIADKMQHVTEGTRFYAEGTLQKGKDWVGSDGEKRQGGIEIVADEFEVLGKRTASDDLEPVKAETKKKVEF
jgi:single-stranded DNA-binding protein